MGGSTMNLIFTHISTHPCCARRISGNSWSDLKCWVRHNVISLRNRQHPDCVRQETPSREALWIRHSSRPRPNRTLQGIPSERLAGGARRNPSLEHPELFH